MYAIAEIDVARRAEVLALPKLAILEARAESSVLRISAENKIVKLSIKTGIAAVTPTGTDFEIIAGLTDGESADRCGPRRIQRRLGG